MTKEEKELIYQEKVCDLAEVLLHEALAGGEVFTEGLNNWAIERARQMVRR